MMKIATGTSEVSIRISSEKGGVVADVSDTGIGMSAETLNKLFTPFFQADSDITRKYGGTGLGLSVSKGIVEAHGGKMTAISGGEGKGSTLSFSLPILT